MGPGTQHGTDLRRCFKLTAADRAANRGFPDREAGADDFARWGSPGFDSRQQREPCARLKHLAKQAHRLARLWKEGSGRGEEHASIETAAGEPRIAEDGFLRIGIGDQFGVFRHLKEPAQYLLAMDGLSERRPAGQLISKTAGERRLGPMDALAERWIARAAPQEEPAPAFCNSCDLNLRSLKVGLAGKGIGHRMDEAANRTRGGELTGPVHRHENAAWTHRGVDAHAQDSAPMRAFDLGKAAVFNPAHGRITRM